MSEITTVDAKPTKLSKLERRWFNEYQKDFNATSAALKVYNVNNAVTAASMGYIAKKSVFRKLQINDYDLMDKIGITEEKLLLKLKDKLDAQSSILVDTVEVDKKTGNITRTKKLAKIDDNNAQLKALELGLKIRNKLPNKVELTGENGSPIKLEMLAGIGFLNTPKKPDENN